MTKNRIPTAMAVTLGTWIAALGTAAALTYDLNHPLRLRSTAAIEMPSNTTPAGLAEPEATVQSVLYVPAVTIVGRRFLGAAAAPAPTVPEDLSDLPCAVDPED
jgi:hypothetical protein